jgi:hypothetical protein
MDKRKAIMQEMTELLIEKLKYNILNLQKRALAANESGDDAACRKVLQEQGQEIDHLIKLVETYTNTFTG